MDSPAKVQAISSQRTTGAASSWRSRSSTLAAAPGAVPHCAVPVHQFCSTPTW
jgi:hypothetical protein